MSDGLSDLKNKWMDAREAQSLQMRSEESQKLVALSAKKLKLSIVEHVKTIVVLVLTCVGITLCFIYITPFKEVLSQIGMWLMQGALVLRIAVELYSIVLSSKIKFTDAAVKSNNMALRFYQFRKKVHGLFTLLVVLVYSLGFYLLTPEFLKYLDGTQVLLIDLSYLVGAVIFTFFIRLAIKKEMMVLDDLKALNDQMGEG